MEGWKVMSQVETTQPGGGGAFVRGMQIGVTTTGGTSFSVFVPLTEYNPANIQRIIEGRVAQISAVSNLQSDS